MAEFPELPAFQAWVFSPGLSFVGSRRPELATFVNHKVIKLQ